MVKRIVGWVVLVPLCAVLIVFALANRQLVVVNFNPFTSATDPTSPGVGVPMFLVIFGLLLVGVLLGGIATWFAQSHHRRAARTLRREDERSPRELAAAHRAPATQPRLTVGAFAHRQHPRADPLIVKICGRRTPHIPEAAIEAGADVVGFMHFQ